MRFAFQTLALAAVLTGSFWASASLAQWGSRGCSPAGPVGPHVPRHVPMSRPGPQPTASQRLSSVRPLNKPGEIWLQVVLDDPAAEVFLSGKPTTTTGLVRNYVSPPLLPGEYSYTVEVHWPGATKAEVVPCKPGDALKVTMVRPRAKE